MEKQLSITRILDYNDIPLLFIAEDIVRTKFIALLVEDNGVNSRYMATAISTDRLLEYTAGKIDLRTVFDEPEILGYWFTIIDISNKNIKAKSENIDNLPSEYLPDKGYYHQAVVQQDKIIALEMAEKDNVIIHLSLDDGKGDNGIKATALGDAATLYQSLLTHSYKKTIAQSRAYTPEVKRALSIPQNSEIRAFASSAGSFNIHFFAISNKDLFGQHFIEIALSKLDEVLSSDLNDIQMVEKLRAIKGHPVKAYKKLLSKIVSDSISIKYNWASPSTQELHTRVITKSFATRVIDILNQKEELSEEIREFTGYMEGADVKTGAWRLKTEESEEITGDSDGDILKDITLDTVLYKLICNEIIEVQTVSEAEKKKYILKTITAI